jgi:hypothetical protein
MGDDHLQLLLGLGFEAEVVAPWEAKVGEAARALPSVADLRALWHRAQTDEDLARLLSWQGVLHDPAVAVGVLDARGVWHRQYSPCATGDPALLNVAPRPMLPAPELDEQWRTCLECLQALTDYEEEPAVTLLHLALLVPAVRLGELALPVPNDPAASAVGALTLWAIDACEMTIADPRDLPSAMRAALERFLSSCRRRALDLLRDPLVCAQISAGFAARCGDLLEELGRVGTFGFEGPCRHGNDRCCRSCCEGCCGPDDLEQDHAPESPPGRCVGELEGGELASEVGLSTDCVCLEREGFCVGLCLIAADEVDEKMREDVLLACRAARSGVGPLLLHVWVAYREELPLLQLALACQPGIETDEGSKLMSLPAETAAVLLHEACGSVVLSSELELLGPAPQRRVLETTAQLFTPAGGSFQRIASALKAAKDLDAR